MGGNASGTTTRSRRTDTREAIQHSALTRFTEHGYDGTSLREIADGLGITKAAVYYHFRSKDEILQSLLADAVSRLDGLIEWVRSQPSTRQTRLELLERLSEATRGDLGELMRCVQVNETALATLPADVNLTHRYKHELWEAATPPDASVDDRLRFRLAVTAVLLASQSMTDLGGTAAERSAAALRVGSELMP